MREVHSEQWFPDRNVSSQAPCGHLNTIPLAARGDRTEMKCEVPKCDETFYVEITELQGIFTLRWYIRIDPIAEEADRLKQAVDILCEGFGLAAVYQEILSRLRAKSLQEANDG